MGMRDAGAVAHAGGGGGHLSPQFNVGPPLPPSPRISMLLPGGAASRARSAARAAASPAAFSSSTLNFGGKGGGGCGGGDNNNIELGERDDLRRRGQQQH